MTREFFLEENRSEFSNNVEGSIDVDLSTKVRLLPNESIKDELSLYEQYNKERDECTKFRLIVDVNTVCSNVLFNLKTEIIDKEGSDACDALLDGGVYIPTSGPDSPCVNTPGNSNQLSYYQAIKDTEYSHDKLGNLTYHCGLNIFNNHMLRSKNFAHVNPTKNGENTKEFNTLSDYARDCTGTVVEEEIKREWKDKGKKTKLHIYQYDNILSMKNAFYERCKEVDGWWGFYNPNYMNMPNFSDSRSGITINSMMANRKPCEFIDLYPDRTLFSFIPKYNPYRKRIEKNWDYCITYPYKKDFDKLKEVLSSTGANSFKSCLVAFGKKSHNSSGVEMLQCSCVTSHNLRKGDEIVLYYGSEDDLLKKTVSVASVGDFNGDFKRKIFSVKLEDVPESIKSGIDENIISINFRKIVNGLESEYYFRVFKKLRTITDEELKSDVNKVAFSQNIYGDKIAQVIFLDDIDLNGLVDNIGRPLSDVYFTVVKRNAGYKEWYDKNNAISENVEYSHCFGKVTSGIDMSEMGLGVGNEPYNYNVRRMHNLKPISIVGEKDKTEETNTLKAWGDAVYSNGRVREIKTIEDDITIDFDEFYGDIVEFDRTNFRETVLEKMCHRVNTAQREAFSTHYKNIKHDVITRDDYDVPFEKKDGGVFNTEFTVSTYYVNDTVSTTTEIPNSSSKLIYGNISPEGYFYNPHFRIPLREVDFELQSSKAKFINYSDVSEWVYDFASDTYSFSFPQFNNAKFFKGDSFGFYSNKKDILVWGKVTNVTEKKVTVTISNSPVKLLSIEFNPNSAVREYYAFWSQDTIPTYASFVFSGRKFVWRGLIPQSRIIRDSELYDMPFSNGRLYTHNCVNLFMRRQDPDGRYGLSVPLYKTTVFSNPMAQYVIGGYGDIDFSKVKTPDIFDNTCF